MDEDTKVLAEAGYAIENAEETMQKAWEEIRSFLREAQDLHAKLTAAIEEHDQLIANASTTRAERRNTEERLAFLLTRSVRFATR